MAASSPSARRFARWAGVAAALTCLLVPTGSCIGPGLEPPGDRASPMGAPPTAGRGGAGGAAGSNFGNSGRGGTDSSADAGIPASGGAGNLGEPLAGSISPPELDEDAGVDP